MAELLRRLNRFIQIKPNPEKLLNYLLNKISKSLKSNHALGMPHRFLIEVTNFCNLHCLLCPTGNNSLYRDKTIMVFDDFKKIIDKVASYLIEISIAGFGEPFLNEDIYRMLEYVNHKGIFMKVYTNLLCLDNDGLRKIIDCKVNKLVISLDAPDVDKYSYYKGIDGFHKVVSNLRYLIDIKKQKHCVTPLVVLQFLMVKDNVAQIQRIREIARDIGVDILSLKTPNLYLVNYDNRHNLELDEHFLSEDFNRYRFNSAKILPCPWAWENFIIYANGDIGPCCYDAHGNYIMGNILLEDISDIWNNKRYREFRRNIVNNTNNNQLCVICMERRKGVRLAIGYPINKFRS